MIDAAKIEGDVAVCDRLVVATAYDRLDVDVGAAVFIQANTVKAGVRISRLQYSHLGEKIGRQRTDLRKVDIKLSVELAHGVGDIYSLHIGGLIKSHTMSGRRIFNGRAAVYVQKFGKAGIDVSHEPTPAFHPNL